MWQPRASWAFSQVEPYELKVHVPQPGHVLVWIERAARPTKKVQEALVLLSCNLENRGIIHYLHIYIYRYIYTHILFTYVDFIYFLPGHIYIYIFIYVNIFI